MEEIIQIESQEFCGNDILSDDRNPVISDSPEADSTADTPLWRTDAWLSLKFNFAFKS